MLLQFREIWLVGFAFTRPPGERPVPTCFVAREFLSNRSVEIWIGDSNAPEQCPIPTGPEVLFVMYKASEGLGGFFACGWPLPRHVIDLHVEVRNLSNGPAIPCDNELSDALAFFGLSAIIASGGGHHRELAMRGGPYPPAERMALLSYCQGQVGALAQLVPKLGSTIDVTYALYRGRYMAAAAQMEWNGIPIDTNKLALFREHWTAIQDRLIDVINPRYGVYDGRTFKVDRWEAYLVARGIPWPRLESGSLALDDETFRQMAKLYPREAGPMRELRHTLGQFRLNGLTVGADGRNRCPLTPFRSRTGRNQPSTSDFIFGSSVWLRSLIKPEPGRAVAYIDWSQQEFAIAAALSRDGAMMEAYQSGDPYLAFAKQAGAIPRDATKESHPVQRERFKVCVLAVQYGMGAKSLADKLGEPEIVGCELLRLHKRTYPVYWRWSQAAVDHAMLYRRLHTVFGWNLSVGADANPRSLANFPCQANGAEMLRLACCLIVEQGIPLLAPMHDAVMVEADVDEIDAVVARTQAAMCDAGRIVLDGFELRTDADVVVYPNRYSDERGVEMWSTVNRILTDLNGPNPGTCDLQTSSQVTGGFDHH